MAEATDADRERARQLRSEWMTFRAGDGHLSIGKKDESDHIEAIAAALAEEREKARAPFLALAEDLEEEAEQGALLTSRMAVVATRVNRETAYRIRRAAEGTL